MGVEDIKDRIWALLRKRELEGLNSSEVREFKKLQDEYYYQKHRESDSLNYEGDMLPDTYDSDREVSDKDRPDRARKNAKFQVQEQNFLNDRDKHRRLVGAPRKDDGRIDLDDRNRRPENSNDYEDIEFETRLNPDRYGKHRTPMGERPDLYLDKTPERDDKGVVEHDKNQEDSGVRKSDENKSMNVKTWTDKIREAEDNVTNLREQFKRNYFK